MNIIELAKEAGFEGRVALVIESSLERFAALVRAKTLTEHIPDATKMVSDTNPLSVFAKECVLGAYTFDELPDAAQLALKRAKVAEPVHEPVAVVDETAPGLVNWTTWKVPEEGTKLYAAPVQPVKQEPVAEVKVRPLRGDESTPKVYIEWKTKPTQGLLYAAPVDAKAIRAEERQRCIDAIRKAHDEELCDAYDCIKVIKELE